MFLIIARRCTKGSLQGLSHKKGVVFSLPWAQYCTSQHAESLGGALLGEVMQEVQSKKSISEQPLPYFGKYQVSTQSFRKVFQSNILIMLEKHQLCQSRTVLLNSISLMSLWWSRWPRVICSLVIGGICSKCPYIPLNSSTNIFPNLCAFWTYQIDSLSQFLPDLSQLTAVAAICNISIVSPLPLKLPNNNQLNRNTPRYLSTSCSLQHWHTWKFGKRLFLSECSLPQR